MSQVFHGCYLTTIFRNEQDGYTIFILKTTNELQRVVKFSGEIPAYQPGTPLEVTAQKDPKGSDLMIVQDIVESTEGIPQSDVKQFLISMHVPVRVAINVSRMGKDFYKLLQDYKFLDSFEKEVPYGHEVLRKIKLPVEERLVRERIKSIVGASNCPKYNAFHSYCEGAAGVSMAMLSSYPYNICERHLGMSFFDADKVAAFYGKNQRPHRIEGMVINIMKDEEKNGSTAADINKVVDKVVAMAFQIGERQAPNVTEVENALEASLFLDNESKIVSFQSTYNLEKMTDVSYREMRKHAVYLFSDDELKTAIETIEKDLGITYATAQKRAFNLLRHTGVSILTGGPGTGKTTCVNGLIRAYKSKYPDNSIVLCAPTGRAAQRMSETTGMEASTIHRLLGIGKKQIGEVRLSANLIICDESSMLDAEMVAFLFMAAPSNSLILLVGDVDQLPSVGAGDVLSDLINSKRLPCCRLETVYRQSGESKIVLNANAINNGEENLQTDDTFAVRTFSQDEQLLSAALDVFMRDQNTQLLCPSHKGKAGIQSMNKEIQSRVNPRKPGEQAVRFGSTEFRIRDRVIMTQNNYEAGYFNGDMGVIKQISASTVTVMLENKEITVKKHELGDMALSYCISIHKSQGSEFENVCIVLPENPQNMLKRNLLYTGVTRAKKKCIILEQQGCISKCVNTIEKGNRTTRLKKLICA